MNCPDFNTLMMFLDSELGEERMKEISEHVKLCSRCRDLINSERNLETSWRDNFVTPEEDKFRSMEWIIYRRIHRSSRWKFFVPAAAGIIAVLLGVKLIMNNEPFKGRATEFLREGRTDYVSYTLRFEEERDELPALGIDGFDSEETATDALIATSTDPVVSTEDVSGETTSEAVGYGIAEVEVAVPQSAESEDGSEGNFRGMSDVTQEADRQAMAGGEVIANGSGGIGGSGPGGGFVNEEEYEEAEAPEEIVCMGAVESVCLEEQMDDIGSITLFSDADTTGLAVTGTVPSSTEIYEDTGDNRVQNQSYDYYSRFHETSGHDLNTAKANIYVKLVFDAGGHPDSSTAFLLDSLFADWSDYIPFVYRDTVLVVPLAGVSELFMEGSTVPAETIE